MSDLPSATPEGPPPPGSSAEQPPGLPHGKRATSEVPTLAPWSRAARTVAALALLAAAATYVLAQLDFFRRHRPSLAAAAYWLPQATQILLPGLGAAALLAAAAFALCRAHPRR